MDRPKWINNKKDVVYVTIFTLLYLICFPVNPLVLTGVLEVKSYQVLFIIGFVVLVFGMVQVMAPIVMFPRRGGVAKGKAFVNTTRLVNTGIYAVVRHPQYTGGIYTCFITTLFWYPHWLFAILGIIGAVFLYLSTKEEDKRLIKKFGDEYLAYMDKVPRMNIFLGIVRILRSHKHK